MILLSFQTVVLSEYAYVRNGVINFRTYTIKNKVCPNTMLSISTHTLSKFRCARKPIINFSIYTIRILSRPKCRYHFPHFFYQNLNVSECNAINSCTYAIKISVCTEANHQFQHLHYQNLSVSGLLSIIFCISAIIFLPLHYHFQHFYHQFLISTRFLYHHFLHLYYHFQAFQACLKGVCIKISIYTINFLHKPFFRAVYQNQHLHYQFPRKALFAIIFYFFSLLPFPFFFRG